MRSKLFVPGSRPELFDKALASDADAVSFDLEDAVPESAKRVARDALAAFLQSPAALRSAKALIVRINGPRTAHFADDVAALIATPVAMWNLPKIGGVDDVLHAVRTIESCERRAGLNDPKPLLVNIETAGALRQAWSIATAHPRVAGVQLGLADLFEPLGIERSDAASVHAAQFALRLAAGEAGRFSYDCAFPDVQDEAGFELEAHQARRMGYVGKSCIHPKQIAIANRVFARSELDRATAQRIVAEADTAAQRGRGAFLLDGRMIDRPMIERARELLARSRAGAPAAPAPASGA